MKTFGTFLLLLLLGAPAAAQSQTPADANAPETHGLSIVKTRWQKRYYNPALDDDPLRGANDALQLERDRRAVQRSNNTRQQLGRERLPMPTRPLESSDRSTAAPAVTETLPLSQNNDFYIYEVKVINTGKKKVKSLEWDYVLFDSATQREVGRHSFETRAGIDLGKGRTLVGASTVPPASIVDASRPQKGTDSQYTERVDIQRVVYEDGAVWERQREN